MRDIRLWIGLICILSMFFGRVCFHEGCALWERLLYCFSHANVFHLAANLICLRMIRIRAWEWLVCYAIGVVCTFLPSPVWSWTDGFVDMPSCGLSGVLMAAIGILWGRSRARGKMRLMAVYVLLPVVVAGLLPNINALVHIWCFTLGYFWGYACKRGRDTVAGRRG